MVTSDEFDDEITEKFVERLTYAQGVGLEDVALRSDKSRDRDRWLVLELGEWNPSLLAQDLKIGRGDEEKLEGRCPNRFLGF